MKISEFISIMEALAPADTALSFDNVGLLVGTQREDIRRVLVALDCTCAVVDEAAELDADLILTHHPLMFSALKRILPEHPDSAAVFKLIRGNIALFSAHTNLDAAQGGVNTQLCRVLGIRDETPVAPENIMRIGFLDGDCTLRDFAELVERRLNTRVRVCGDDSRHIRKVAVLGGSGGSDVELAHQNGADVLVTGECKHSQAISASVLGISVIAAGHYETERVVLSAVIDHLQKSCSGVEYILSKADGAVLRTI